MKNALMRILPWSLALLPLLAHADATPTWYSKLCDNPQDGDPGCIPLNSKEAVIALLLKIVGYFRTIFWIIAVGMLIWAAYLYLLGGTNEANTKKAKQVLNGAIVGMIVALIATSIPILVKSFLSP